MGTYGMKTTGYFKPSHLGRRQHLIVIAFSVLFTINIAVSNLSLDLVSVPFYQTMRMLVPFFTVVISKLWLAKRYPLMTYLALVPIIIGSAMTTIGELSFTDAGFLLTILGVVLAAVKVCLFDHVSLSLTLSLSLSLTHTHSLSLSHSLSHSHTHSLSLWHPH